MKGLKIIENELIPVYETSTGEKVVYGSEVDAMEAPQCVKDQEKRLYNAMNADNRAVISPKDLADALGSGVTKEGIINAAYENMCPFVFGNRSHLKRNAM